MVWQQYVWEATNGNEIYVSDEEIEQETPPLSFEDWELQYSDSLRMMWNTIRTLMYDAHITYHGDLCDFTIFSYTCHQPETDRVYFDTEELTEWFEPRLFNIWNAVMRIVKDNGIQEEVMKDATFYNFVRFSKDVLQVQ